MADQSLDQRVKPPAWAVTLLRAAAPPRDRDMIAGDLLEEYREEIVPARGRLRAQLWYLQQALSFAKVPAWAIRVYAGWTTLFVLAALVALMQLTSQPWQPVVTFLIGVPIAAFQAARRTEGFWMGFGTGMALCATMLALTRAVQIALALRHPPGLLGGPLAVGVTLALIAAIAGKHSTPSLDPQLVYFWTKRVSSLSSKA